MNRILPQLLTFITGKRREKVTAGIDFQWASKNWTHNAFRLFELIFWRRAGIRFEGLLQDTVVVHGTWEHFLAHQEGRLRALKNPFAFKLVPLPVFITPDGQTFRHNSIFNFAIAYDTSAEVATSAGTTTVSGSYTVTGSNPILLSWSGGTTGASSTVTGVTYNSVGMSAVKNVKIPSDRWWDSYILPGPATGAHTLAVTSSDATNFWLGAVSYSGAAQSAQPDNTNTATVSGNATLSGSITVNTANSWVVFLTSTRGFTLTSESNVTARLNVADMQICDSNVALATGSFSCSVTIGSASYSQGGVLISLKPLAGTTYTQTYTEAITVTSTLLKSTTRPLVEAITNTDTLLKSVLRLFTEAISLTDTDTNIKVRPANLTDAVTATDTFLKSTSRVLVEAITNTDTFITVKNFVRTYTEAITNTDTLLKASTRVLTEAITVTSSFIKSIARTLSEIPTTTNTVGTSATSAVNDASAGTVAWSNPSNVLVSDGVFATVALTANQLSQYIDATGFGFSIPGDATITGIGVSVTGKTSNSSASSVSVQIIKGGVINPDGGGTRTLGLYTSTNSTFSGGSSSDLWNETLAPSDVNASNFGVAMYVQNGAGGAPTFSVDYVSVTVYYSAGGIQVSDTLSSGKMTFKTYTELFTVTDVLTKIKVTTANFVENIATTVVAIFTLNGQSVIWTHIKKSAAATLTHLSKSSAATWTKTSRATLARWTHIGKSNP